MIDISQGDKLAALIRELLELPDNQKIDRIEPIKMKIRVSKPNRVYMPGISFSPGHYIDTVDYTTHILEIGQS